MSRAIALLLSVVAALAVCSHGYYTANVFVVNLTPIVRPQTLAIADL